MNDDLLMKEFIFSEGLPARLASGRDYMLSRGGCQPHSANLLYQIGRMKTGAAPVADAPDSAPIRDSI